MKNFTNWISQPNIILQSYFIESYKKLGLSDREFMLILHLQNFSNNGVDFPTPEQICNFSSMSSEDCSESLYSLIVRGYIRIEDYKNEDGMHFERYNINVIHERLAELYVKESREKDLDLNDNSEINLYPLFEQEFGRPLTHMEGEILSQWLDVDQHNPSIIRMALKEAILSSALNFRYIERILYDWKKKGIKTPDDARKQGEKVRGYVKSSAR
jgi:DNA replication protein